MAAKETKTARAARAAAAHVGMAAQGFASARQDGIALAFLRANFKTGAAVTREFKMDFYAGRMAAFLFPTAETLTAEMLHEGKRVLNLSGATGKDATKRRTPAQDKAYAAARKALSRLLTDAGLVTDEKRGGARKPRAGESQPATDAIDSASAEADAANDAVIRAESVSKITTAASLHAFAIQQATALMARCDAVKDTPPSLRKIIATFRKEIMAEPAPK